MRIALRPFVHLFALLLVFSAAAAADDPGLPPEPESMASVLQRTANMPPDQAQAEIAKWNQQDTAYRAAVAAKQKKEDAATALQWATSLDTMAAGGWQLIEVSSDGQDASFGTRRSLRRDGKYIYVWFRYEYRHPQVWQGSSNDYMSLVERQRVDCLRGLEQTVQQNGFGMNNLTQPNEGESATYPETSQWTGAIPGTVGEELINWACKSAPKPAAAAQK